MKNLGEEFWEDGAVKQQRPSAKSLEVKGTEGGRGRPRGSEVIGTSKQARPAENDSNLAERRGGRRRGSGDRGVVQETDRIRVSKALRIFNGGEPRQARLQQM